MNDEIDEIVDKVLQDILISERAAASSSTNVSTKRQSDILEIIKSSSEQLHRSNEAQ